MFHERFFFLVKMGNPCFKLRKVTFLTVIFMLLADFSLHLVVLITFRSILAPSGSFGEIQRRKMAAIGNQGIIIMQCNIITSLWTY